VYVDVVCEDVEDIEDVVVDDSLCCLDPFYSFRRSASILGCPLVCLGSTTPKSDQLSPRHMTHHRIFSGSFAV